MPTTNIPVTITPEAEDLMMDMGLRRWVDRMVEHTRETIPDLVGILVRRYDDPEMPSEPRIFIQAWQSGPPEVEVNRQAHDDWVQWFVREFPSTVTRWVMFDNWYRDGDER
jgi:hypothetical protein